MQRISGDTRAVDLFGAGRHGFTGGNPETQVPATILTPEWANSVQEELARAIEVFEPLDPADPGQLAAALARLVTPEPYYCLVPLRAVHWVGTYETSPSGSGWFSHPTRDFLAGFNGAEIAINLAPYLPRRGTLTKVGILYSTPTRAGADRAFFGIGRQLRDVPTPAPAAPYLQRTFVGQTHYFDAGGEQVAEITLSAPITNPALQGLYLRLKAAANTNPSGDNLLALWLEGTTTVL